MSLEDQYDAWVRGLMSGGKYAASPEDAAQAREVYRILCGLEMRLK